MSPIYLLPLGGADRRMTTALCPVLEDTFGTAVSVRDTNIELALFYDERRLQYNSSAIITYLNDAVAATARPGDHNSAPRFLAVLGEDLFIPILTYVFGEAQFQGRVAVVSYHRLQNERYGLPRNPALTFDRLCKESVHELGHIFGLVHCTDQQCAMHISTYVEDIDMKPASFCPSCLEQLEGNLV